METATTVNITRIDEPDELFCHYPGQYQPQPCHLALDLEDGELTASYNPEIGSGRPASVYHRRTLWAEIPCLTADAANALLDEVAPTAQRVLDGATIEWNGNNHVGHLTDDAEQAWDALAQRLDPAEFSDSEIVSAWDADDWFGGEGREQTLERLNLTADTTDEQITAMAAQETEDAKGISEAGYVILRGAGEYLTGLREDLRNTVRDDLEQVAEQLDTLTGRRNSLIRRLAAWGDSSRTIGACARLSHVRVQQIAAEDPTTAGDR